ncbi:hypothetical protein D3C80_1664460 [compost metagenome]
MTSDWQFDHLAFNTLDGDGLQAAFAQLLGLTPGPRPPFPFPGRWLYLGDQALVHVIERHDLPSTQLSHLALRTTQPAAQVLAGVRASGLPHQVAQVPEDGVWQIFVQLPGGLVLELDAPADTELAVTHDYLEQGQAPA